MIDKYTKAALETIMSDMTTSPATMGGDGQGGLRGAKVFVVGASSGMGEAIAKMAAARGAQVALVARNVERLAAVAAQIGEDSVLGCYSLDIADDEKVEAALAEHGPYDHILTTAADLNFGSPLTGITRSDIDRMLGSKFWGPVNLARSASTWLKPTGSLIFISGLGGYRPVTGCSIVGPLNMGLEGLATAMAIELSPRRVNAISPGIVETPIWLKMPESERLAAFAKAADSLPTQRIGSVTDIAHAALALMENGFITGTVVHVDGGGRLI